MMQYNRVGNTSFRLSAIGFGSAQFPMVPEQQAIDALKRGFELGVNWVHVSHEYGDAELLMAQAIEESGRDIVVLAQASGDVDHFEACFESTCRVLGRRQLDMFGINCVNDCEYLEQNVWGPGGMAEFRTEEADALPSRAPQARRDDPERGHAARVCSRRRCSGTNGGRGAERAPGHRHGRPGMHPRPLSGNCVL